MTSETAENNSGSTLCITDVEPQKHIDVEYEKKQLRRLDWGLIPWMSLLYLLAFLTRTNIGNAKIAGLSDALHLDASGTQYNTALAVFFISYALFEPASNVLLKMVKPSHYLPGIMFVCGVITIGTGFVKDAGSLYAVRFLLGVSQAGVFPGVNYILSCWYKRSELGIRTAIFFSAAAISGSFGGLLSFGLQQMDGVGGEAGWSWIFIIEGIIVVLVSFLSYWMVFNFPDDYAKKTNSKRSKLLRESLVEEQSKKSSSTEELTGEPFIQVLKASVLDWKTWTGVAIYGGAAGPLFAFALFLPSIIADMGDYSATVTQLMTIPPYVVGCLFTLAIGVLADRTQQRGLINICCSLVAALGFFLLLFGRNTAMKYIGTFFAAIGIYSCIPNAVTWCSNNIIDDRKRGLSLGMVIGIGNLNGVVNCFIYRNKDKPNFRLGHSIVLGFLLIFLFGGSCLQHFLLIRENNKKKEHRKNNITASDMGEKAHEGKARNSEDNDDQFVYVV